jgi:molybdate transport system substrate-binding protein
MSELPGDLSRDALNHHTLEQPGAAGIWISLTALAVLFLIGCGEVGDTAMQARVTVLAAASTADAMDEIALMFKETVQIQVQTSTGPSNGLAQQILAGAPADLFLCANKKWSDKIADAGLSNETFELLTNHMVLIVPKGNAARVTQPSDLSSDRVTHVAIASENVPAGIYAEQGLRTRKLFETLKRSNRLARGSDVRVALAYVEREEAEAGIVYATDARNSAHVEVIYKFDSDIDQRAVYPVVLLKTARDNTAAHQFFRYLQSEEAASVFRQHGFTPLSPSLE